MVMAKHIHIHVRRSTADAKWGPSEWIQLPSSVWEKLVEGKVYKINGRGFHVISKAENSGQRSSSGLGMGGNPMVRGRWKISDHRQVRSKT